nr:GNAT family N-acetyltransferase [Spirochaetales bacterium]
LLQPEYVDPGKTRKELESTLKEQIVLMGEYRGVPVAKVGTNARGIRYDQIGGVFTDLPYRGRHFARYLMIELLKTLKHQKKSACLFVKNKNAAALHLYEALQFKYREPFRIHYF